MKLSEIFIDMMSLFTSRPLATAKNIGSVTAAFSADWYLFDLSTQATFLLERRFLMITRLHSALECKHLFACELDLCFSLTFTVEYWVLETSSFN